MSLIRQSNVPLYQQLAEQLTKLIKHGDLRIGTRLSVRKLAREHKVSKGVAETAIEILKDEGYLKTTPRSGTFVSPNLWDLLIADKTPDWQYYSSHGFHQGNKDIIFALNNRSSDPSKLQMSSYHFYEPDFDPYFPLSYALSVLNSAKYLSMLTLYDKRGLPMLREAVVKHVAEYGIKTSADNIVIFDGVYEALTNIFHSFLFHGSNIFIAGNDVITAMPSIPTLGGNIHPIAMDNEGLITADLHLKAARKKHCLLYINPVNHFPSGISISARRRRELLEEIKKTRIPVIENDMLRDINTEVPPPLKADDENEQIIYIGSFANTYLSASKTAWVIAPAAIVERMCDIKVQYHARLNTILELLSYIMLSSGKYGNCMEKIRVKLDTRTIRVNDILFKHFSEIAFWDEKCLRYHVWLRFIPEINTDRVFMDCPGIFFIPGSTYNDKQCLLLNSVCSSLENFETAVRRIASAARRQIKKG